MSHAFKFDINFQRVPRVEDDPNDPDPDPDEGGAGTTGPCANVTFVPTIKTAQKATNLATNILKLLARNVLKLA